MLNDSCSLFKKNFLEHSDLATVCCSTSVTVCSVVARNELILSSSNEEGTFSRFIVDDGRNRTAADDGEEEGGSEDDLQS